MRLCDLESGKGIEVFKSPVPASLESCFGLVIVIEDF